jgi:N-acetylglucosaminyldiphosphoundecaprenol N-acetyl-beta-D-mannosaminyltransferase
LLVGSIRPMLSPECSMSMTLVNPGRPIGRSVAFPAKVELFNGVQMTPTNYTEVVDTLIAAARARQPALAAFAANHILAMAACDPAFRARMNDFDLVAPDGQPVRWAMNYFHAAGLTDRVYGPELTKRLCAAAAEQGVPIYLFGSTPDVIEQLRTNLMQMFPALVIAGAESPPFRPLTADEDAAVVKRINDSGAGLLFIGIGAPKQENFAHAHRHAIVPVQVCVGAAFDFHAGVKSTAPAWMQKRGLEWLYRLVKEPRRLWKRYLVTNTVYLALFGKHAVLKAVGMWPKAAGLSAAVAREEELAAEAA